MLWRKLGVWRYQLKRPRCLATANEIHSAWTLNIVGVSGKTCTLNWRTLRKWNESRVVYEHHYDQQQSGELLTFDDLGFDIIGLSLGFKGDRDR
jgi:hypothetical protein